MENKTMTLIAVFLFGVGPAAVFSQKVKDIDGNVYNTVTIGTQVWMAENLKTMKYNDGNAIPLVTDSIEWSSLTAPGYCWLKNDSLTYKNMYGALYNWYTVITGKLCPNGWHIPADVEWTTLTDYLGGAFGAGNKLKEKGTAHWPRPNTDATNEVGFTALPSGERNRFGVFSYIDSCGFWWSSTENKNNVSTARDRYIDGLFSEITDNANKKRTGFSIRCIKD